MAQTRRMRRKFQRGLCPYDDAISKLKGGMQTAPKWLNSVRKYPPSKMYLTPGKVARPSEFWNDKIRNILLRNRRRPSWIPSLPAAKGHPQVANIMAGAHFNDAFSMPSHGSDPDIEFAACQAWFMTKKGLNEDEAYEQARFRMRDLLKQKERVWEVYRRKQMLSPMHSDKNNSNYKQYQNERIDLTDSWINSVNNKMKTKMNELFSNMQNIHQSTKNNPNLPGLTGDLYNNSRFDTPSPQSTLDKGSLQGPSNNSNNNNNNNSEAALNDGETDIMSLDMSKVERMDRFSDSTNNNSQDQSNIRSKMQGTAVNPYMQNIEMAKKQAEEKKIKSSTQATHTTQGETNTGTNTRGTATTSTTKTEGRRRTG